MGQAFPERKALRIVQGDTFDKVFFQWRNEDILVYKSITAIPQLAPVRLTSTSHGVPDGWPVTIANVGGMKELNDVGEQPATLIDANTIELNAVNAAGFDAYTSGGQIVYFQPFDLASFTARMKVRASISSSTVLLDMTDGNGGIVIDNTKKRIQPFLTAVQTAALTWTTGVYDLEMVSGSSIVTKIAYGPITVALKEVTR